MKTIKKIINKNRIFKPKQIRSPALRKNPQMRGLVQYLLILAPKKPNSAKRKVVKIIGSKFRRVFVYIPGEKHNLVFCSKILIRGGRTKDLPGLKYRAIRNVYDLNFIAHRKQARSKYGTKFFFRFKTRQFIKTKWY